MNFSYLSVCSGLGGAELAFLSLGARCVGVAEIETFPSRILAHRFGCNMPGEPLSHNAPPNFGDFTTIDPASLGRVDVLIGGTPCQAFSIAGNRLSLADARGNLTLAYSVLAHELVRHAGLRNAVWENVPGCLSTDDNAFGCFLGAIVGADDPLLPCVRPARGRSNDFWRWRDAGRWPVLDDDGNETGEFVEREEGHIARWPGVGMASGPRARAAWRILDAQYFGVPQRRRRVFLVADFGNGADPAKVLFERKSLCRDTPPRRKKGQGIAGAIAARTGGGGGLGADFECDGGLISSTGDISHCLNAGGMGRQDYETETLVAHALRGEGFDASDDGTGRGTPIVPVIAPTMRCKGDAHSWVKDDDGLVAVAYDLRGREGGAQFEGPHDTANLRAASGGSSRSYVCAQAFITSGYGIKVSDIASTMQASFDRLSNQIYGVIEPAEQWSVRRLLPIECERLQGVPDNWTDIPGAADGPRYKALGNSWAIPVVAWIGARLAAALEDRAP